MASFRRTMSPVQRDGGVQIGETFLVSSSSPKLTYTQKYLPSGSMLAKLFGYADLVMTLHGIQNVVLATCLKKSSRTVERSSKLKGNGWKRALFHFFVCFLLGIFIGLTPFFYRDFSACFVSKHQAFSFEVNKPNGNEPEYIDASRYNASLIRSNKVGHNASLEAEAKQYLRDDVSDAFSLLSPVNGSNFLSQKLLIIVTPTYNRPFQAYYLNRLAQTLRLVPPPLLWMVVEISFQSPETAEILRRTGVMYRHLVCQTNLTSIKGRSIHQRNVALSHIEKHQLNGIVYFADEHNMHSLDLFEQMREVRRFGIWSVAFLVEDRKKGIILEGPVCNGSQVIGWHTKKIRKTTRRFYVNMSGFAFNTSILWDPRSYHRPTPEFIRQIDTVKDGLQVSTFIEQLIEDESQMEGLPNECSRIMVWNLHLEAPHFLYPQVWSMQKNLEVVAPLT